MSLWKTNDIDYAGIGFRCGIEIHQQLDTKQKLFCHCPVGLVDDPPDARVLRHMRPTLSEMGEYDPTALMEKKTRKEIIYEILNNRVCTYELDDSPPFPINQQAVEIGIRLALLFQCNIVDEAHISRKQYLDGSIPTGFQRTTVIGTDGWIPYKYRRIKIPQVNIEEDSCREVDNVGHNVIFRTDRLSIPLVEVITDAELYSPQEAFEVTWLLAETNRISGLVRRGIGAARQDVNVSIAGGSRVEIKGVDKISHIPALTHFEALRQKALLNLRDEIKERGISDSNYAYSTTDATANLARSPEFVGNQAVEQGGVVSAIVIKGFRGLMEKYIFPERIFADEIAGRVRVIACLDKMPNIAHRMNRMSLGIPDKEWEDIRRSLDAEDGDATIITWGPRQDVNTALEEIAIRCREAIHGVPPETRNMALNERYSDFERLLPGPDRMYPDTDHPPIEIDIERVESLREIVPDLPWDRRVTMKEMGLPDYLIDHLVTNPRYRIFLRMAGISGNPKWAAQVIVEYFTYLHRRDFGAINLSDDRLLILAQLFGDGIFHRESTLDILKAICVKDYDPQEAIDEIVPAVSEEQLDSILSEIITIENQLRDPEKRERFLMGEAMRRLRGAIPGKLIREKLSALQD
ncbi:MAG: Glu-tRNA(Gln) amidotransferase subunit GatE [candidate division Zixibacteria bacterium]|nr:Glu-tRNA(Gln) amidotransferase subunit GatE [candidate division Zixibacteria bacterium]